MGRISLFNSPFLLGFDQLEQVLDAAAKSAGDGYPPYNIEDIDERTLRISLAVAGFSKDNLEISVEDNQLLIRGRQSDEREKAYLHRGIAARQFQRKFILADGIEIVAAHLDNGLLHIDLLRPEAENIVRTIKITEGRPSK